MAQGQGFWKAGCLAQALPLPTEGLLPFAKSSYLCLVMGYSPLPRADFGSLLVGRGCEEYLQQPAAPYRIFGAPPITACLGEAALEPSAPPGVGFWHPPFK